MNKSTLTQANAILDRIEKKLRRIEKRHKHLLVLLDFSHKRLVAERQRRLESERKLKQLTRKSRSKTA